MKTIEPKVIYVAGPMTGLSELNRPAFMEAEKALTEAGFIVLNPAWLPVGLPPEKYMPSDHKALGEFYRQKGGIDRINFT